MIGAIVTASILVIGGVFYAGFQFGALKPKTLIVQGVENIEPDSKPENTDFNVFWEAWDKLKSQHIKGAELQNQDMLYGAIEGLVNSLKDPYTIFLRPDDSKKFEEDVGGSFGGIGAEIGVRNDQLVVIAPLEDTPAMKAGLRAGDKILEIDKKSTAGLSVNEAVKKIRGLIGTKVVLTILRNGDEKPKEITITRDRIEVPTLKLEMKDGGIAFLQLFEFNQNAPFLFYKTTLDILRNEPKGMILDLRNNPGGYLEVAVNIAGWFLKNGDIVVTEKFRNGDEVPFYAKGNSVLKNLPLVILVNKGSASASEILAGALRENRKVELIGENTFGKGTVQELQELKDGSKIKITIAQWLLPNDEVLSENGLAPDIEVKLNEEDIKAGKDAQLDKAIEELKKIIQ